MDLTTSIREIVELVGMPLTPEDYGPVDAPEWTALEFRVGLEIPQDYKELISIFGNYSWAGFLHLLNPFTTNPSLHLERAAHRILGITHENRREDPSNFSFAVYPEKLGLFPCSTFALFGVLWG